MRHRLAALSVGALGSMAMAAALVAACSSFGGDDSPGPEVTPPGSDAAPPADGGIDPPIDAGDSAVGDGGRSFCSTVADAALCADFEDGRPASYLFALTGDVKVTTENAWNGGSSMRVRTLGDASTAAAEKTLTGVAALGVAFRTHVDLLAGDASVDKTAGPAALLRVALGSPTDPCRLSIIVDSTTATFHQQRAGKGSTDFALTYYPGQAQWFEITMELYAVSDKVRARITSTGQNAFVGGFPDVDTLCTDTELTAGAGVAFGAVNPGGAIETRFDDIVIRKR